MRHSNSNGSAFFRMSFDTRSMVVGKLGPAFPIWTLHSLRDGALVLFEKTWTNDKRISSNL
jgi:hypothetical protein